MPAWWWLTADTAAAVIGVNRVPRPKPSRATRPAVGPNPVPGSRLTDQSSAAAVTRRPATISTTGLTAFIAMPAIGPATIITT
jgi:hypothetical protein